MKPKNRLSTEKSTWNCCFDVCKKIMFFAFTIHFLQNFFAFTKLYLRLQNFFFAKLFLASFWCGVSEVGVSREERLGFGMPTAMKQNEKKKKLEHMRFLSYWRYNSTQIYTAGDHILRFLHLGAFSEATYNSYSYSQFIL